MEQLKVFEFAKEIGMETLALMDKIREWKLPVKSHMATLDDQLIEEIRQRLQAEKETGEPVKKKTAVRKAAAPKAAKAPAKASKPAPRPTTAATRAEAAAAGPDEAAPAPAKPKRTTSTRAAAKKSTMGVIRRKASEVEARAQQAAQEAAEAAAQQAAAQEAATEAPVAPVSQGPEVSVAPQATPPVEEAKKPRGNIVGRMDLRRVVTMSGPGAGPSGFGGGPRSPRTAPRPIRAGFVAPMPVFAEPDPAREEAERKNREEKERKARRPAAGREAEQVFTATEFRKREVIFQPKKKKVMIGRESKQTAITTPAAHKRVVKVNNTMTVSDLAQAMNVKAPVLIKKLMAGGVMATMNTDLDFDTISLLTPEFGFEAQNVFQSVEEVLENVAFGNLAAEKITRPPIVTVMGHVDHGKTTLLDAIRSADVASGEAGGITQHIGAYTVKTESGSFVTFIDTPGHEAFTSMRARGANVTDIAIIVVAADDGMMPQTAEAINHAKAAGVPIIVAVNKMDRPGANPERIKQQLTEFELVPEEWGGTTIYCPVSALKREGIAELLEQIHLLAEVQDLKANPERSATGVILESRMEKGRGAVATLLVKDGTLKVSDDLVAGMVIGRVRSMMDEHGKLVKAAGPGHAVEIMGLPEPPQAGDRFDVVKDENLAQKVAQLRLAKKASESLPKKLTVEEILAKAKGSDAKEMAIVIKADVAGSLEAIRGMIEKAQTDKVKVKVLHGAIGGITESDVLLASTAEGVIIGFNVRPDGEAQRLAKEKSVEIRTYSIVYELMDDLKKLMTGMLEPVFSEKQVGRAEVRNTFVVPKIGTIAGCFVVDGKITRGNQLRLVRDGRIIYEGKLSSLKRFKDDVKEVASGFECGLGIENFNDIKVGDTIEAFIREQTAAEL